MPIVRIITVLKEGKDKNGERWTFVLGLMVLGCIVALPSPGLAESLRQTAGDVPSSSPQLEEQTQQLDDQLADLESRLHTLTTQRGSSLSKNSHHRDAQTSRQIATRIDFDDSSDSEGEGSQEEEVQQLEETVVEGMYLDPFSDETDMEIIKDPWEPMNAKVFSFNLNVDRYVLKPVATGYAWIVPDPLEQAIGRAIDNIRFVPRTVNDLLQWKWKHAGIEVGRFLVNSTAGVAGFFDVAGELFGIYPVPEEDFGQTLATHGVQAGPYLVLPLLPPTTVRDGVGTVGDVLLDPLTYFLPFIPQASLRATEIVNERSQNLELYEGVEVATLDMYGAVREAYSQKRAKAIRE